MKLKRGDRLVVASHNKGKVREITALLAPLGFVVKGADELGLAEPDETGLTYEENALLKARAAAETAGMIALADDSGLSVDALGGQPGIHSARWAGPHRDFDRAMQRVEASLMATGVKHYDAKFVCVLALASPSGESETFRGEVRGHLEFPPRGTSGFGYDPIFVADGMSETFGEIDPALKHSISHRARAFEKFVAALEARA